jgi:ADP-ribose pyrophosphatase
VETSPPSQELLLQARRFQVVRMSRSLPNGTLHAHDVVLHPGAVILLPMVSASQVCLIRNFRVAVGETLVELPAGTIDNREDPLETARRELAEETGYRAGKLERLCEFFMSPGILNERMHVFLATDLTSGAMALESGEEIQTEIVEWDDALAMIDSGQIRDAKTLAALMYYDRIRRRK